MDRNDPYPLTLVLLANFFRWFFSLLKLDLNRCRISRAFRKYKIFFGIAWFRVVRDEKLENCQNSQLVLLPVYWHYQLVNGVLEVTKLSSFVEKTFLHLLRRLWTRTDEWTHRKMQNISVTLKSLFFDQGPRAVSLVDVGIFHRHVRKSWYFGFRGFKLWSIVWDY